MSEDVRLLRGIVSLRFSYSVKPFVVSFKLVVDRGVSASLSKFVDGVEVDVPISVLCSSDSDSVSDSIHLSIFIFAIFGATLVCS